MQFQTPLSRNPTSTRLPSPKSLRTGSRPATSNDTEKFTGYYRDASTGLDYADQRYHQPGVGRFMSPDPFGGSAKASDPGSWNRYSYVEGDPVNGTDPSGLLLWVGGDGEDGSSQDTPDYFGGFSSGWIMGGVRSSQQVPSWQEEWDGLSETCQNALKTALGGGVQAMIGVLNRALTKKDVLVTAANQNGVDWGLLGAIGIIESGFRGGNEIAGTGVGVGVFQITVTRKSGVTATQANNLAWAANWTAGELARNASNLAAAIPGLSADNLAWMVAASHNTGYQGQINRYNNGQSPALPVTLNTNGTYSVVNAQTGPVLGGVLIQISDVAGSFMTGNVQAEATTLLHELGHAMNFLFGPGTSGIDNNDTSPTPTPMTRTANVTNTDRVSNECFGKMNSRSGPNPLP